MNKYFIIILIFISCNGIDLKNLNVIENENGTYTIFTSKGEVILNYYSPMESQFYENLTKDVNTSKKGWSCRLYKKLDSLGITEETVYNDYNALTTICSHLIQYKNVNKSNPEVIFSFINKRYGETLVNSLDKEWKEKIDSFYHCIKRNDGGRKTYIDNIDDCEMERLLAVEDELKNGYLKSDSTIYFSSLKNQINFDLRWNHGIMIQRFFKIRIYKNHDKYFVDVKCLFESPRFYLSKEQLGMEEGLIIGH